MTTQTHPRLFATLLALASFSPAAVPAADDKKTAPLDPRGRPDEKLIDQPQRYYVWHDAEGWHLRSAAKGMTKFEGSIKVVGGTFRKLRPAGLESKGNYADRWALDDKRQEIRFLIHTSTSFDGFDFDLAGDAASLEFDLSMGGTKRPRRIFVGREAAHPPEAAFSLPADPDKAFAAAPGDREP